jgi:Spy/CpxP family protein refolding chaperone
MRRARAVAVLLLGLVFGVGALAGMAVEEAAGLDWFDFLDEDARPSEARLFSGMRLTDEQERRIADVLERREERLEAYWESRLPEIGALMNASYAEVREVLTPEQRPAFDARVRELRGRVPLDVGD